MTQVDLTVISDDILDGVFNRLLVDFATAKDMCDTGETRAAHDALVEVIAEYARRTDAWIAERVKPEAEPTHPATPATPQAVG